MELDDEQAMPSLIFPKEAPKKRKMDALSRSNSDSSTSSQEDENENDDDYHGGSNGGGGRMIRRAANVPIPGNDLAFRSNRLCRQPECTNRYRSPGYLCELHGGGRCQAEGCIKLHQGRQGLPHFFFCRHHRKRYAQLTSGGGTGGRASEPSA